MGALSIYRPQIRPGAQSSLLPGSSQSTQPPIQAPVENMGDMSWSLFDKNVRKLTAPGRYGGVYGAQGSNVRDLMSGYNERKANFAKLKNELALSNADLAVRQAATASQERTAMAGTQAQKDIASQSDATKRWLDQQQGGRWEQEFGFTKSEADRAAEQWGQQFGFTKEEADRAALQWQQQAETAAAQWQQQFGYNQQQAKMAAEQWEKQFGLMTTESQLKAEQWAKEFGWSKEQAATMAKQWEQQFAAGQKTDVNTMINYLNSAEGQNLSPAEKEKLKQAILAMLFQY